MEEPKAKKRFRAAKQAPSSGTDAETGQQSVFYQSSSSYTPFSFIPPAIKTVSTDWTWDDYIGQIRCRVSAFRYSYIVTPGLYAVGKPDKESDVFVSANYKMSFDILRRSLKGMNAWVLVLDTKGINVWCAAGKGSFGTDELVRRISDVGLDERVSHRRVIIPQLGGPGISAHIVGKKTGFRVHYGPVDAKDIPAYVAAGYKTTREMRTARFTWLDRLVLTPMEINPVMKKFHWYALTVLVFFGLQSYGIIFRDALTGGWPFLILGLASVFAGTFVTPLLLPFIPFRSFAVKGWISGLASVVLTQGTLVITDKWLLAFTYLFFPLLSSYIALQFTGSTTFTGMSGVKKELSYALPLYKTAAAISILILVTFKLRQLGVP